MPKTSFSAGSLIPGVLAFSVMAVCGPFLFAQQPMAPLPTSPMATLPTAGQWRSPGQDPRVSDARPMQQLRPADSSEMGLTPDEQRNIYVYDKGNRSVCHIMTRSVQRDTTFGLLMSETPSEGSGSGSVLDKQGHILTNYHVIEGATEIDVTLFNAESYPAELVGQDPVNDIAVLKIDVPADLLVPVELGDSSNLRVGQKAFAIGNPFGLERTMTIGIISSLNRMLPSRSGRTMKAIIQIDAALNRGNSGGPLFDSNGRLIGMNTAIASRTGQNTGVGFAIPVATIRRVAPQLIAEGKITRPDLGVSRVYLTDDGLGVASLVQGGPAEQAGLQGFQLVRQQVRRGPYVYEETRVDRSKADVITAVDGTAIESADDLLTAIERKNPGEVVKLSVLREGKKVDVPVTLGVGD
ncbi:trypsin-like peptidase domain-containing protein [Blastopirellula sp. JC732]|uniref:Trypsin-like peptidase domain-containing protein n=1 Tax=Blastopirellula sediminis TaxID=2894196 RepID=A0A9X1MNP1_9BACT|nr:trypsin-like peptidase domain-containing protein [Blastopirellula sediminis]MCC9607187.1 trypsin-like peptidase domain-containing protein [Blastopirellula sediminis]MCC9629520.1 trypsin-like peptidase domain-containing protein [Blastopirellula sediminis]